MPPADLPPPDLPRLFIGGLPPTLPTSSLLRLLSRFVHPHTVHRHPTRPFAHISLSATDEPALARCIAALNNTTWCGTRLRIQKAIPHYWQRLSKEWQTATQVQPHSHPDAPHPDDHREEKNQHFGTLPKGKHIAFDFPDLDDNPVIIAYDDQSNIHTSHAGQDPMMSGKIDCPKPATIPLSVQKSGPPKSDNLTSTIALFGLTTSSPSSQTARAREKDMHNPDDDHLVDDATPPRKRQRTSAVPLAHYSDIAAAQGGQADPEDLGVEKEKAFSVLRKMFPAEVPAKRTSDELIAQNRRLALFRKLPGTNIRQPHPKKAVNSANSRQRHRPAPYPQVRQPTQSQESSVHESQARRAGLYKELASTNVSAAIGPDDSRNS